MTGHKRFLLKTIRKTTSKFFFWHLIRADGLEKQILNGKICGTKSIGRLRTKYTDSLNNFKQGKNLPTMSSSGELTTERIGRP